MRARREPDYLLQGRVAAAAAALAPIYRQRGRELPAMFRRTRLAGGAGSLIGRQVLVVADDADTRDLFERALTGVLQSRSA